MTAPRTFRARFTGALKSLRQALRSKLVLDGPPSKVGLGLALGIFVGCSPLYGFHALLAVFLATLLRLNPLIAVLGTQISLPPLGVLIIGAEVGLGEWIRYGRWTLPPGMDSRGLANWVWEHALLSWALGSVLVGAALAAAGGGIGWRMLLAARQRRRKKPS